MNGEHSKGVEAAFDKMPSEIAAAIVDAQGRISAVAKDATNSFHRYRYASAEAVIAEARHALNGAGLAALCLGWRIVPDAQPTEGSTGLDRIEVRYRLLHKSGAFLDLETSTPVIPDKGRPEDKAEATALTYNLGYTLRGLLLIPRGEEDADADRRDDTHYQPAHRQGPARQAPTQAPATRPAAQAPTPRIAPEEAKRLEASWDERLGAAKTMDELTTIGAEIGKGPFAEGSEERTRLTTSYKRNRDRLLGKPNGGAGMTDEARLRAIDEGRA